MDQPRLPKLANKFCCDICDHEKSISFARFCKTCGNGVCVNCLEKCNYKCSFCRDLNIEHKLYSINRILPDLLSCCQCGECIESIDDRLQICCDCILDYAGSSKYKIGILICNNCAYRCDKCHHYFHDNMLFKSKHEQEYSNSILSIISQGNYNKCCKECTMNYMDRVDDDDFRKIIYKERIIKKKFGDELMIVLKEKMNIIRQAPFYSIYSNSHLYDEHAMYTSLVNYLDYD